MDELIAVEAGFEITSWDEEPYEQPGEGPKLTRVTLTKTYAGEIDGEGACQVLTAQGEDGGGYVASERVSGTLAGRTGSFVIQHAGLAGADGQSTSGAIVPGSGTGGLAGIAGTAQERQQGVLSLAYHLPG